MYHAEYMKLTGTSGHLSANTENIADCSLPGHKNSLNTGETSRDNHPGIAIQDISRGAPGNTPANRLADSIDVANGTLGNRAFMQLVGELHSREQPGETHNAAATGLQGPGRPPTHLDTLHQAFGRPGSSGMRQHTGPETRAALDSLGAGGFTSNGRMAFATCPDLHTQAHEAAHGVQQAALGKRMALKGGIGMPGDHYERHADAVADAVAAGRDAQPVLDRLAPLPTTVTAGKMDTGTPLQMVTARMRQLIPDIFKLNQLIPGIYPGRSPYRYKYDDTATLMKNYRMGGKLDTGFSRPLSILNRLAVAHITGDDLSLLHRAYCANWWPGYFSPVPQRAALQHLGQLLDETSARTAGGRYLRLTSAVIDALSQGDKVIIPTFNAAELIQTPMMFGLPFNFYTQHTHFGMQTDAGEKVLTELIVPDNHRLGLPYGTLGDAKCLYAPHLICPWMYTVEKISVVGAGFREAKQALEFVKADHSSIKFIKLRALERTGLNEMITTAATVRNLFTGRNLPLSDLVNVYTHLYRHRTSEKMPPIDMPRRSRS